MTKMLVGALAVWAHAALPGAQAQMTNAICLSTYDFLNNSKGQSPCLVAAYAAGACNGGQYNVSALYDGEYYFGPSTALANNCQCSSVLYSLMSACGVCQNHTIITWSAWDINCKNVYLTVFPENIPSDTVIPAWAYINVSKSDTFNPNDALSLQPSPAPSPQTTPPATTASLNQAKQTNSGGAIPTHIGSASTKSSNTAAIAEGAVGAVVLIALVTLLAFFFIRQRNNKRRNAMQPRQYVVVHGAHQPTGEYNATQLTGGPFHDPIRPPTSPSTPPPHASHYTEPPPYDDDATATSATTATLGANHVARLKIVN